LTVCLSEEKNEEGSISPWKSSLEKSEKNAIVLGMRWEERVSTAMSSASVSLLLCESDLEVGWNASHKIRK
jgi:hypothetical protein